MKTAHFGGEDVPLHANELRNPTTEQLDAWSKFFREQQFARLAVTMSKSAVLTACKIPLEIITGSMMNRYTDLLTRVSPEPNEGAFLHEASSIPGVRQGHAASTTSSAAFRAGKLKGAAARSDK